MTDLPEPLVPADVDLRDFPFTPIFRAQLFASDFHTQVSDAGWRAGVTLWLRSWDQSPSGTLPADHVSLCKLADLGKDLKSWNKVKNEALWGWFECSDNRLHHKTVAEGVMEAWKRKTSQRDRTEKARQARHKNTTTETVTENVTTSVTETVTGSKGQWTVDRDSSVVRSATPDEMGHVIHAAGCRESPTDYIQLNRWLAAGFTMPEICHAIETRKTPGKPLAYYEKMFRDLAEQKAKPDLPKKQTAPPRLQVSAIRATLKTEPVFEAGNA